MGNCNMNNLNFPKYNINKHKGNVGEAIAQYFLSKFCLVHKIDGCNDLGNDFICELIKEHAPTNLLFYVQAKFTKSKPRISKSTENYWKSSPIPVYIFWISEETSHSSQNSPLPRDPERMIGRIKYLRMTPKLHLPEKHADEAYKKYNELDFKRDLLVDYARTQYAVGFTPIIKPRSYLSLEDKNAAGIGKYVLYVRDVIPEYRQRILGNAWAQNFVVAELLFQKGDQLSLRNAQKAIDLAFSLISDDDKNIFSDYYARMCDLRQVISNSLESI